MRIVHPPIHHLKKLKWDIKSPRMTHIQLKVFAPKLTVEKCTYAAEIPFVLSLEICQIDLES